jgi:hypothetical protein
MKRAALNGLLPYDFEAQYSNRMIQSSGTPPIPRTVAAIVGGAPTHMSRQVAANVSVGIHNARTLPGTLPIERLVEELNRFGPDPMNAFPLWRQSWPTSKSPAGSASR